MRFFHRIGEFFEAPNGRFDLKQPSGLGAVSTLCYVALTGIPISAPLVWALMVFGILWVIGDVQTAMNVIKAAAGGFRVADTINQAEGGIKQEVSGANPTIVQSPSPGVPIETPTTTTD